MINDLLNKLKEVDPAFNIKHLNVEITDYNKLQSIISHKARFIKECGLPIVTISLYYNSSAMISMALTEFDPCCGKVLAKQLRYNTTVYNNEKITEIDVALLDKAGAIYIDIIDEILKHCVYTSISFIVSKREQLPFYQFITKIDKYKVVNEFVNKRMEPTHSPCVEFCKNLW